MSTTSVIGAVMDRYDTFTFTGKPSLYFDKAPNRTALDTPTTLPYVILKDKGTEPLYDFEHNVEETTKLDFEVWALSLATADAIAYGIHFNGGAINAGLGMDFADTLATLTGQTLKEMVWERERRSQEDPRNQSASLAFKILMSYHVSTERAI